MKTDPYFYIFTPSGFRVPGMRDTDERKLWERYAKTMQKSPNTLIFEGYKVMRMSRPQRARVV